jgi:flagellar hook protein FlgE
MNSAFSAGVQGLNNASSSMSDSASNIAQSQIESDNLANQASASSNALATEQPPVNLTNELINLRVQQFNAQSSIRTIQTADEVLGTLIDVRV